MASFMKKVTCFKYNKVYLGCSLLTLAIQTFVWLHAIKKMAEHKMLAGHEFACKTFQTSSSESASTATL